MPFEGIEDMDVAEALALVFHELISSFGFKVVRIDGEQSVLVGPKISFSFCYHHHELDCFAVLKRPDGQWMMYEVGNFLYDRLVAAGMEPRWSPSLRFNLVQRLEIIRDALLKVSVDMLSGDQAWVDRYDGHHYRAGGLELRAMGVEYTYTPPPMPKVEKIAPVAAPPRSGLDRSCPFVAEVFRFAQGEASIDASADLLERSLAKWQLDFILPPFPENPKLPPDEATSSYYLDIMYFGFLSETHLVLQTARFSPECDLLFDGRYAQKSSAKEWAAVYARWANHIWWRGRAGWKAIDFLSGDIAIDYWPWAEAAWHVVHRVAERHAAKSAV